MSFHTRYLDSFEKNVHRVQAVTAIEPWKERGIKHGFVGRLDTEFAGPKLARQVHGTSIVEYNSKTPWQQPSADGIWTMSDRAIIGVQTADCLPILIYHDELVMAVHAGWRGLLGGILVQASKLIHKLLGRSDQCFVAIGPAISLHSFEVGSEVIDAFANGFALLEPSEFASCVQAGKGDRSHLDLKKLAALQILHLGFIADHIWIHEDCTKRELRLWHSYRRDGVDAGRNISWISKD